MDRVFAVVIHLDMNDAAMAIVIQPKEVYHFNLVAFEDLDARKQAISLMHQTWKDQHGVIKMPPILYCEVELVMILSKDVFGAESVDGG